MSAQPGEFTAAPTDLSEELTVLHGGEESILAAAYEASKSQIINGGDWRVAVAEFIDIDRAIDTTSHCLFRGLAARLLEYSYKQVRAENGTIDDVSLGVRGVFDQLDNIPPALTQSPGAHNIPGVKRQPSFLESLQATTQRYRFMEQLPQIFSGMADGIIVGGSMAYGPFYSVRSGEHYGDASDIDALIILNEDFLNENSWIGLLESPYVSPQDKASLLSRFALFSEMRLNGEADIISQRFDVAHSGFNMSAHLLTFDTFQDIAGAPFRAALEQREDALFTVLDYKPKAFEHAHCVQTSFDGSAFDYEVPPQSDLHAGKLARLPAYIINNGKYHPGIYQNLISPEFEAWDDPSNSISPVIDFFRGSVLAYIQQQKEQGNPAQLELSHIRSAYFSPGRYTQRANLRLISSN